PTPVEVLRTSAARNDAGAFGAAGCDEAFLALALLLRDQRSDARGRGERVAHPERPGEVRNGRAASIARSASVKVPVGAAPNGSSVAGQMIGVSSWSLDGCHAPPMKRSVRSWVRVLISLLLG